MSKAKIIKIKIKTIISVLFLLGTIWYGLIHYVFWYDKFDPRASFYLRK